MPPPEVLTWIDRAEMLTPRRMTPTQRCERVERMARYWMLSVDEMKHVCFSLHLLETGRIGEGRN